MKNLEERRIEQGNELFAPSTLKRVRFLLSLDLQQPQRSNPPLQNKIKGILVALQLKIQPCFWPHSDAGAPILKPLNNLLFD